MAAVVAALLAACGSADKRQSPPSPLPAPAPALIRNADRSVLTVSDAEGNARVVLERGQQLAVRLPTGVTSGLEWSLVDMPPGVLAPPDVRFERASRELAADEAAGTMVWRFSPVAAGTVALRFDLRRPRSRDPAARSVGFDVTVQ